MGLARPLMFFDLMHKHDPEKILEVTPRGRDHILKPVIDDTNKHIVEMKMSDKTSGKKKRGGGNRGGGYGARGGGYGARGGSGSSGGYNNGLYRQNNQQYSSQKPVIGQMFPAANPRTIKPAQYSSSAYGGSNMGQSKKSPSKGYQVGGSAKYVPPGAVMAQSPKKASPTIQPGPVTGAYRQPPIQSTSKTIGLVKIFLYVQNSILVFSQLQIYLPVKSPASFKLQSINATTFSDVF